MPVPQRGFVEWILDPYRRVIVEAVQGAWQAWRASPYPGRWRCPRSRANFVWEEIIDRASIAFSEMPDVRIISRNATYGFLIDERVFFRFKKADGRGLSANIPTQLALAFHDHDQDLPNLPGLPDVQRVEVVYTLNRLKTQIADISVVARNGNAVVWSFSLLTADADIAPLPVQAPSSQRPTPSVSHLIRPRNASGKSDRGKQG